MLNCLMSCSSMKGRTLKMANTEQLASSFARRLMVRFWIYYVKRLSSFGSVFIFEVSLRQQFISPKSVGCSAGSLLRHLGIWLSCWRDGTRVAGLWYVWIISGRNGRIMFTAFSLASKWSFLPQFCSLISFNTFSSGLAWNFKADHQMKTKIPWTSLRGSHNSFASPSASA